MSGQRRTALLAGATGLVGRACLQELLASPAYDRVIALVRRDPGVSSSKLEVLIADLQRAETIRPAAADDVFCALGTTIARAGSQPAFRAVDYQAVLAVADLGAQGGAQQFTLVSSVGADPESSNFYLRVKGESEAAVSKRPFRAVHVLRPSLLLGPRAERRPKEALFQRIAPLINPLLVGSLRKYRALDAQDVAIAMVAAALEGVSGRRVLHYDEIERLARR